jgi:predicted RNA-binding Zn-ribbon protein involved in translation (DUF1610 family)
MTMTFRVSEHTIRPGVQVLEILHDGMVCGILVPHDDYPNVVRLISAHLLGAGESEGVAPHIIISDNIGERAPIPTVAFIFDPGPYIIDGGRIVRTAISKLIHPRERNMEGVCFNCGQMMIHASDCATYQRRLKK